MWTTPPSRAEGASRINAPPRLPFFSPKEGWWGGIGRSSAGRRTRERGGTHPDLFRRTKEAFTRGRCCRLVQLKPFYPAPGTPTPGTL
ncbi:hypothetical protein B9Q06_03455 [Candidatus Marsarchaeota G2 archaeon ECH_B_2]|uniref:Uncharacterized protein n=2 Tax=Candidatus Marsarchaeota group 2 TaxID=2203771 RepID=A0A2R6BBY7_9ARCH|nr:MAG: hypothetical protein B9Q06_08550 [Candidatus Marsarchaeota G2 archaeon ECH_B_2]PSN96147.1 MAG: hypothetical protein B9Q06_03455 [Candidatus Marsarchaeota G2 archaeon ECH_B_2]PSO02652.1 MAG: hypothetical protein B9Q05_03880 [Candidatus Marsarchaeota G2 archaeon ECH_B_1]